MSISRAISIKQPFVEQILRGTKRYEYRTIPTKIRERVYLYASLSPRTDKEAWRGMTKLKGQLPLGLIVGSVEIVDCRPDPDGYAYKLAAPKRLRVPLRPINQPCPVFWRPIFKGN